MAHRSAVSVVLAALRRTVVHSAAFYHPCLRRRFPCTQSSLHRLLHTIPAFPVVDCTPTFNSLTLCHCNLVSALSNVLSTSLHLLTLPTPITPQPSPPLPATAHQPSPASSPPSSFTPPSITVPPRFTIRVVTDLEPVTPPTSRAHSPSPSRHFPAISAPSSPTHLHITLPAVHSDAPTADQNGTVVKATLHLVSAAAASPASPATPTVDRNDNTSHPVTSLPLTASPPTTLLTEAQPSDQSLDLHPANADLANTLPLTAADAAASVDKCDAVVKATNTTSSAATALSHVRTTQPAASDGDDHRGSHSPACHPLTRSTSTPVHPFFIDLAHRAGKAAKHFRRLYAPSSVICECGLFPVFADQRHSSAPTHTLPEPFQCLCLACLEELFQQCAELSVDYRCNDVYLRVVSPLFRDDAWHGTLSAHYDKYYTPRQVAAIQEATGGPAAEVDYMQAFEWVKQSLQSELHSRGRRLTREYE